MSRSYRRMFKIRDDESPVRILTRFKTTNTPPSEGKISNRGQKRKLEELQNIIKEKRINFESNVEGEDENKKKKRMDFEQVANLDDNYNNKNEADYNRDENTPPPILTPNNSKNEIDYNFIENVPPILTPNQNKNGLDYNSNENAAPLLKSNETNIKNNVAVQKALQFASYQHKYPNKLEGREFDPEIHCGVVSGKDERPCVRSLTCRVHKKSDKNKVIRSTPLNELLEIGKLARQSVQFFEQVKHLNTVKEIDQNDEDSKEN